MPTRKESLRAQRRRNAPAVQSADEGNTPRDATIVRGSQAPSTPVATTAACHRSWALVLADTAQRGSAALVAAITAAAECATPRPGEGVMLGHPAAGAMAVLAISDVARRRSLLTHGAADALLQQLAAHGTHAPVVEASCRAFVALTTPSPDGKRIAIFPASLLTDMSLTLVGAITRHVDHAGAVAAASAALANVTSTDDDAGRVAALQAGALAACTAALARHAASHPVTCGGPLAGALSNIASLDGPIGTAAVDELVRGGVVQLLLRCLRSVALLSPTAAPAIENGTQLPPSAASIAQAEAGFLRLARSLTRNHGAARLEMCLMDGFVVLVRCARRTNSADVDLFALQVLANTLCNATGDIARSALNAGVLEAASTCAATMTSASSRQSGWSERKLACAAVLTRLVAACASDHAAGGGHTLRLRAARCGAAKALRDTMAALPQDMRAQALSALGIITTAR